MSTLPDLERYPDVPLEPASSIVIIDESGPIQRYLMGKRSEGHVFLPGFHVFPGGRVELEDLEAARTAPPLLSETCAQKISASVGSRADAEAHAIAALRELREETGYAPVTDKPALSYFARAITPEGYPRRYDTRFFAAFANEFKASRSETDDELDDVQWVDAEAMGSLKIHFITKHVLGFLTNWLGSRRAGSVPDAIPCLRPEGANHVLAYE